MADLQDYPQRGRPLIPYDQSFNVVGVHRERSPGGRSLILNGHVDVVPAGPVEMWTRPPFEPHVEDGWMYGRGVADMKAGLVAALFALDAVREAGLHPVGDVIIQSVVEEECTGNGTLACIQRGYTAEAAIFPEPTFTTYVKAQVGLLWFRVHVAGNPAHASIPGAEGNAIERAFQLLGDLKALEKEWNRRKREHAEFADIDHPINLLLGRISGGDWTSSVPAWCTMDMRVGLYPGIEPDQVRAEVEACLVAATARDPFLVEHPPRVEWIGHYGAGYELTGTEAPIAVLDSAHQEVFGSPLHAITASGSSDARVLGLQAGIPSIEYGPISGNVHGFDECVDLESVRQVTKSLALFIASWCGVGQG